MERTFDSYKSFFDQVEGRRIRWDSGGVFVPDGLLADGTMSEFFEDKPGTPETMHVCCGLAPGGWSFANESLVKKEEPQPCDNFIHMTVRDIFAQCALQGLLARPNIMVSFWDTIPAEAYKIADAMMKERAKGAA